jgi:hypothetical protein
MLVIEKKDHMMKCQNVKCSCIDGKIEVNYLNFCYFLLILIKVKMIK